MQNRKVIKKFSLQSREPRKQKIKLFSLIGILVGFSVCHVFGFDQKFSSWISSQISLRLSLMGFSLKEVVVEGHGRLRSKDLISSLELFQGKPLFDFDLHEMQDKALQNPWIRSIVIQRRLPHTFYLRVVERYPIGLWKNDKNQYLMIDSEGKIIGTHAEITEEYKDLPVVLGESAPDNIASLLKTLSKFPEIQNQVTAFMWVGERRWDIILNKKIQIQLPEFNVDVALKKLSNLQNTHNIFEKKILKIDLRVENKIILKPSPGTSINMRGGKVVSKKT